MPCRSGLGHPVLKIAAIGTVGQADRCWQNLDRLGGGAVGGPHGVDEHGNAHRGARGLLGVARGPRIGLKRPLAVRGHLGQRAILGLLNQLRQGHLGKRDRTRLGARIDGPLWGRRGTGLRRLKCGMRLWHRRRRGLRLIRLRQCRAHVSGFRRQLRDRWRRAAWRQRDNKPWRHRIIPVAGGRIARIRSGSRIGHLSAARGRGARVCSRRRLNLEDGDRLAHIRARKDSKPADAEH